MIKLGRHKSSGRDAADSCATSGDRVLVFARYPEPGKCKTRLIPALGPDGAAQLQEQMTRATLQQCAGFAAQRSSTVRICFADGDETSMRTRYGDRWQFVPQRCGDLGLRLHGAVCDAFQDGAKRVVVVGTDCPGIRDECFSSAFRALRHVDLVLGPATDGGYYLVGLRRPIAELFENVSWGSETVLQETMHIAREFGLSYALLEELADVDRPEDLPVWHATQQEGWTPTRPEISVVVPTLNEADSLDETLRRLAAVPGLETIVVDASPNCATQRVAQRYPVKLVSMPPGRAAQMNAGASVATGKLLLFLHADTRLPDGFEQRISQCMAGTGVVGGAFRLRIDSNRWPLRLIAAVANLRSASLGLPYGDQALFTRCDTFRSMGGFPQLPIMEDFEFVRNLRRYGRVPIVPAYAVTSPRRWDRVGVWRTTWINQRVVLGYCCGISPDRLARWYHRRRPK